MKIKINSNGCLEIFRKNQYKVQLCPFNTNTVNCGDWCPLFEEQDYRSDPVKNEYIQFEICKKEYVLLQSEFTDERV
jgi:hypothetical protein